MNGHRKADLQPPVPTKYPELNKFRDQKTVPCTVLYPINYGGLRVCYKAINYKQTNVRSGSFASLKQQLSTGTVVDVTNPPKHLTAQV